MSRILDLLPGEFSREASTKGGEFHGPCPWCGGDDRLCVWPDDGESGRYHCIRGCGAKGDGIDVLRELRGLSFAEACEALGLGYKVKQDLQPVTNRGGAVTKPAAPVTSTPRLLNPPGDEWQQAARAFVEECEAVLWSDRGESAREWLHSRGLTDETIRAARLGANLAEQRPRRSAWGLSSAKGNRNPDEMWLPRGIVIPWLIGGDLWKVNIRRPDGDLRDEKDPKYIQAAGSSKGHSTNGLYGAEDLRLDAPAVLVEGELDALSVRQEAGDVAAAVATGSTHGSRRVRWVAKLAAASTVLVAFDAEDAGDEAARYWLEKLPNARRWRPYWQDANAMLQDGADVRGWVLAGLGDYPIGESAPPKKGATHHPAEHYAERFGQDVLDELAAWDEPTRRLILWLWWFGWERADLWEPAVSAETLPVEPPIGPAIPLTAGYLRSFVADLKRGPGADTADAVREQLPVLCAALGSLEEHAPALAA